MPETSAPITTFADRIFFGTCVTMDDSIPDAEAVAVTGERISYVGDRDGASAFVGPDTVVTELGDQVLLPGFVEAHGHPLLDAVILGPAMTDIRPVTIPDADDVVNIIREKIAAAGPEGAYFNGWDPLLQLGLPDPTLSWLNDLSPDKPFAILHNSGHSAYFNTAAANFAGVTRDTPDPIGASFGHDENGDLDGSLLETGAVLRIFGHLFQIDDNQYADLLRATSQRMNRVGITTVGELAYDPSNRARVDAARDAGALTFRLRLYEMSTAAKTSTAKPGDGDDLIRQVGIKLWADGSPWVGNIATSFPYLDTPATEAMGLEPHHIGHANYTPEQVLDISRAYGNEGFQLACHAHGDLAIDFVLNAWHEILTENPKPDHRFRLEHVGSMSPEQYAKAAELGVTASLFIDHLYYWGDALTDDLFGEPHGSHWAAARSALNAGLRISFHNDGTVTPPEPLRNIEMAATRRSRSGKILAPEERISVAEALRAQTIDAAYQLFSDTEIGSLTTGKYADLVILASNPLHVDPETAPAGAIANIPIVETVLAGATV